MRKSNEEAARTKQIETVTSDLVGASRRQRATNPRQIRRAEYAEAELKSSLHQEQGKTKGIAQSAEPTRQVAGAAATEQPVSTEANGSEAAGLLARAKALLGQGNIGAARVVLERAAETGSAQATFALAETYDPNVLATWRTYGTRGDVTKARDLYARAYDGGIKAAKDRSDALSCRRWWTKAGELVWTRRGRSLMNKFFKSSLLFLVAAMAPLVLALQPADLHAQTQNAPSPRRAPNDFQKVQMNAWTVGLAGGLLEGAPIRLAAEIARVVDDGPNMHVLPIVTRGATENLNSLLYLRGVDTAIINSDALEEYKIQIPEIGRRIVYLLNLFPSELHIFVRPEIQNLQDLVGKKVNFNTLGTAAAYSGPLIFSRLGLNVEKTFIPASSRAGTDAQRRVGGCCLYHVEAG